MDDTELRFGCPDRGLVVGSLPAPLCLFVAGVLGTSINRKGIESLSPWSLGRVVRFSLRHLGKTKLVRKTLLDLLMLMGSPTF